MIQSYTTNNYPIAYSDHRTILADKYGVIKVQGVVVANEWASLASDDGDAALKEGKTTIYKRRGHLLHHRQHHREQGGRLPQDPDLQCQHSR